MEAALQRPYAEDLGYLNARVRAMRGALLARADYEPLLRLPSASALAESLKSTWYGPYIATSSARTEEPRDALLLALGEALSASLRRLMKMAPDGARTLLKAVLSAWEVFDIKTIVRGMARGVRREEIKAALIPVGEFDAASLDALLSSRDLPDLVAFLETWASPYAQALRPGLKEYLRNSRIIEMELGVDLHAHSLFLEVLEGRFNDARIMRGWLGLKADLQNALTLFKIAGEGYKPQAASGFYLEGGRMKPGDFADIAAIDDREKLLAALMEAGGPPVRRALEAAETDPMLFEEAAEEEMKEYLRALSLADPLSIALPASYIYMLVREIKNLRLISRGLSFAVPYEEMKTLMFYPV